MRIRKHAKISPLLYAASSLKPGIPLQTHVCQLNQSPWDVMTFSPPSSPPPPPPFQVNGSDARAGNGSSDHFVSAVREHNSLPQSEYPDAATPTVEAVEENTAPPPPSPPPPPMENEPTIMCCKTDGKSWQCRRVAAKGNSLCEHHLSIAKNYSNVADHAAKKSVKQPAAAAEAPRRPRPKKAPAASSSNPYEFYYYSGFGPRWGKRRGETRKNNNDSVGAEPPPPPAISHFGIEDFDYAEFEDEDDDDDEEEESRDNGKKRVRKPIKARSLKSFL